MILRKFSIQRAIYDEVEKRRHKPPRWNLEDGNEPFDVWVWRMGDEWGVAPAFPERAWRSVKFTLTPKTSFDESKELAVKAFNFITNDKTR